MKRITVTAALFSVSIFVATMTISPSASAAVAPSGAANLANAGQPEGLKDAEKAIHDLLKTLESENRDIRKALLVAHGSMDPKKIAKALAFVSKSSTFAQDYARNLEAVRVAVAKALEQLNNPVGIPTKELTALRSQLKRELSRVTKIEQAARQVWPTISPVS